MLKRIVEDNDFALPEVPRLPPDSNRCACGWDAKTKRGNQAAMLATVRKHSPAGHELVDVDLQARRGLFVVAAWRLWRPLEVLPL